MFLCVYSVENELLVYCAQNICNLIYVRFAKDVLCATANYSSCIVLPERDHA